MKSKKDHQNWKNKIPNEKMQNTRRVFRYLGSVPMRILHFLCGKKNDEQIDLSVLWTMVSTVSTIVLLVITCSQLYSVKETTSADFSNKIKSDLYNSENVKLLTLFEDNVLKFKVDKSNQYVWFEIDSIKYKRLPNVNKAEVCAFKYNIITIDALIQSFEDLSFYEKKGQISIDYIYDAYAYYIEMLWENPELRKYIKWQRAQPHFSNSYANMESIYIKLRMITDGEK